MGLAPASPACYKQSLTRLKIGSHGPVYTNSWYSGQICVSVVFRATVEGMLMISKTPPDFVLGVGSGSSIFLLSICRRFQQNVNACCPGSCIEARFWCPVSWACNRLMYTQKHLFCRLICVFGLWTNFPPSEKGSALALSILELCSPEVQCLKTYSLTLASQLPSKLVYGDAIP